ncbi:DNA mismatch repair endonuclease MutL [Pseudoalteromonas sp. G4]|uniref:DNA mismatch repair endonuclease MutL n=1 Tax=Pseudoalteromonas sp. G4 TaxID=2992761 RepID=UPI00237DAA6D|nr:DNA mismatch repair endonuclease MutL [Pseudoalteromonas sp. G4]MDE3273053.1 DNA mismatch repair endonuclease MutL [Pseudoalteromonas sp. G4]
MSIQILPARLANQIAAGEVVERPASVVKELVENSLDAGATRIQIDIERGGHKLIRIRDNGAGIEKDQLTLALSRHATSKIKSLDDLEQIISLGFRGEALASISSVSRLTLTSKTENQDEAWQAYAEGRDMAVQITPASHPNGTTIEVVDLFFNTPARRKFLRTEKTEFHHIDELLKRIALSRFDVAITLKHNGKVVRQYRSQMQQESYVKRVAQVAGRIFEQQAVYVNSGDERLSLHGWVLPMGSKTEPQYTYVNGRMMRDKLIFHAIRQTFEEYAPGYEVPGFVIYLDIEPRQIDVNVHPAKHEVRFHQGRLVHDFIVQAVRQAISFEQPLINSDVPVQDLALQNEYPLQLGESALSQTNEVDVRETRPSYSGGQTTTSYPKSPLSHQTYVPTATRQHSVNAFYQGVAEQSLPHATKAAEFNDIGVCNTNVVCSELLPLRQGKALRSISGEPQLIDLAPALPVLWQLQVEQFGQLESKSLLLPVRINLSSDLLEKVEQHLSWLGILGFDIAVNSQFLLVKKLPEVLYSVDVNLILDNLVENVSETQTATELQFWLTWLQQIVEAKALNYSITKQLVELVVKKPELIASFKSKTVKIDLDNSLFD